MSVLSTDLVAYHAANQSDVDGATIGGAIDPLRRPDFTQLASNAALEVVSSAAGDTTQTVTVIARNAAGSIVTQTVTLTGTTAVQLATLGTVERVLSAEMSATAVGTVTLRVTGAGATVRAIPVGERGFSMLHRKDTSSTSGTTTYYAKYFWKNTNGTLSLLSATVSLSGDAAAVLAFGLAAAVGDSATSTNRQTAPGGITFATTPVAVPGTDLAAAAAIGVWSRMTLATNNAAVKESFTSTLAGSTT